MPKTTESEIEKFAIELLEKRYQSKRGTLK